jgi:hypothetical protein
MKMMNFEGCRKKLSCPFFKVLAKHLSELLKNMISITKVTDLLNKESSKSANHLIIKLAFTCSHPFPFHPVSFKLTQISDIGGGYFPPYFDHGED